MTRGDEIHLIARKVDESLFLIDSMPIPLSPATQCLRVALVRVKFECDQVAKEAERASR